MKGLDRLFSRISLICMVVIIVLVIRGTKLNEKLQELESNITILENYLSENKETIKDLEDEIEIYVEVIELYEISEELYRKQLELLEIENEDLRTIRAKLTSYSPLDNRDGNQAMGDPTKTSRGYQVCRGIAASDPKKIPYGTILEIEDYGIVEVQDTGSALRKDNKNIRIDLFADTYKEAMTFGVRDQDIKIIKWGGKEG